MNGSINTLLHHTQYKRGKKLTKTEEQLLVFLWNSDKEVSFEDIFMGINSAKQLVSYATVYANLNRLVKLGVIKKRVDSGHRMALYALEYEKPE